MYPGYDKGMNGRVSRWQDGADLSNMPTTEEAWLKEVCHMQSKMQNGIQFLHLQTQALHDQSKTPEIIELLV